MVYEDMERMETEETIGKITAEAEEEDYITIDASDDGQPHHSHRQIWEGDWPEDVDGDGKEDGTVMNLQLLSGKEWLALHRESWKMFKMRKEEEGRRKRLEREEAAEMRRAEAREEKIRMRKERRRKKPHLGGGGR